MMKRRHFAHGGLAGLLALAVGVLGSPAVQAQVQRAFPANALRGNLTVGAPPTVMLNGQSAQLAPGARIRSENNLLVMSGAMVGQSYTVHYTLDPLGLVMDVWLLREDEKQKFWPRSVDEAGGYTLDHAAQTWIKR